MSNDPARKSKTGFKVHLVCYSYRQDKFLSEIVLNSQPYEKIQVSSTQSRLLLKPMASESFFASQYHHRIVWTWSLLGPFHCKYISLLISVNRLDSKLQNEVYFLSSSFLTEASPSDLGKSGCSSLLTIHSQLGAQCCQQLNGNENVLTVKGSLGAYFPPKYFFPISN